MNSPPLPIETRPVSGSPNVSRLQLGQVTAPSPIILLHYSLRTITPSCTFLIRLPLAALQLTKARLLVHVRPLMIYGAVPMVHIVKP